MSSMYNFACIKSKLQIIYVPQLDGIFLYQKT